MAVNWIEHPQAGTSIQPGDWLCTVESGQKRIKRSVRILQLDRFGRWMARLAFTRLPARLDRA